MSSSIPPRLRLCLIGVLFGIVLTSIPPAEAVAQLAQTYRWSRVLDSANGFILHWNLTSTTLYVGLTANVVGWMGFGVSPSGSMYGADVAVAWVSNGVGQAYDYISNAQVQPSLDAANSVTFIAGSATSTSLSMSPSPSHPLITGQFHVNLPFHIHLHD